MGRRESKVDYVKKSALTAYGKIGTDWVRMTLRQDGVFVRADGSNGELPVLPTTFRTCGDIGNVTATLGHKVSMAAVPGVALPNHGWKGVFTFEEIARKFKVSEELIVLAQFVYSDDEAEELAA